MVAATASESGTARGDVPNVDDNIPGALTSPLEVTPMSGQWQTESMLSPFRVLDLTDEKGFYCGKVLGDLGADVIKIEPPGGDPARNIGPFYNDIPHPERSLYWWAYNTSKRGITLDIETADGQEIFKKLVKTGDIVLESFPPGFMENLGLGYPARPDILRFAPPCQRWRAWNEPQCHVHPL